MNFLFDQFPTLKKKLVHVSLTNTYTRPHIATGELTINKSIGNIT